MDIGCFSISLTVKDLKKSKDFYELLGFERFGGDEEQGYLIMKRGSCNIGLFQGMFEKNIITFNPGWDQDAKALEEFVDVREIQKELSEKGVAFDTEIGDSDSGPASFVITDPDGNPILFDQHV